MSDTPPQSDAPLLESYLASRDVPCPACRYNLRGCAGNACPECGSPLRLGLESRHDVGIPHRMFLLLALGWVLAAGAMNSVRFVEALHEEYRWSAQQPFTMTTPPAAAAPSIFDLSATNWSRAIWAGGLVLGALAGLLLLEREWRGAGSRHPAVAGRDRRIARLVVYCWALFGVYASWHFVVFTRELLGLR